MERGPEYKCNECGRRFNEDEITWNYKKFHYVVGYFDHYDYEEVPCCPYCDSDEIAEVEDDELI